MSEEYEEKILELQKFMPALNKRIEDARQKNGAVGDKWEKVRNILNKKIKVSMEILIKTEEALKKQEKDSNTLKRQDAKPELQIKEVEKATIISYVRDEENIQILSTPKSSTGEVVIIDDDSDDDQSLSKQTMATNEKPSPKSKEITKKKTEIVFPTYHQSGSETPQSSKHSSLTETNSVQKATEPILNREKMAENQKKSREILSSLEKQLMALTNATALPLTIDDIVAESSSNISSSVEQYLSTSRNEAIKKAENSTAPESNDKKLAANIEPERTSNEREILKEKYPLPFKINENQSAASQKPQAGELSSESASEDTSKHSSQYGSQSCSQEPIDADSMNNPPKDHLVDIIATLKGSITKPSNHKSGNNDRSSTSGQLQMPSTDMAMSCNADDTENLVIDETTPIVTSEKPSESGSAEKVDKNESNIPEEKFECENSDANESELLYEDLGVDTAAMEDLRMSEGSDVAEQEEKNENDFDEMSSEESKSPKNTSDVTISPTKLTETPTGQTKAVTLSPTSVKDSNLASDREADPCTKSELAKDKADEEVLNTRLGEDITLIPSTEPLIDPEMDEGTHTVSVPGTTPQSNIHARANETVSKSSPTPTESSLVRKCTVTSTTQFSPASRKSIEDRAIYLPDPPTSAGESASKIIFQVRRDGKFPAQNTSDESMEDLLRKIAEIKRELESLKPKETDSNESERLREPRIRKKRSKNINGISDELNDLSDSDADYLSLSLSEISDVELGAIYSDKKKQEDDAKVEDVINLEYESSSNVISRRLKFLNQGEELELDIDNLEVTVPVSDLRTYLNANKKDNEADKSLVKKKRHKKHYNRDCLPEEKVVMQFKTGRPYRHSSIRFYGGNIRSELSDCKNLDEDDLKFLKHHASLKRSSKDDLDEEDIKFSSYQQVPSDTESVSSSDGINAVNMSPKRGDNSKDARGRRNSRSPANRTPNSYAGPSKRSFQLDELNSVPPRALGRPRSRSISPRWPKILPKRRSKTPERICRRSKRSPRSPRRLSKSPLHLRRSRTRSPKLRRSRTRSPKLRRSRTRSPKLRRSRTRSPKPRRARTRSPMSRRRSLSPKRSRSPGRSRLVRHSRSPRPRQQSLSPKRSRSPGRSRLVRRSPRPRRQSLPPKRSRSPGRPRSPRRLRSPKPSRRSLFPRRSRSPRRLRSPRRSRSPRQLRSPRKTKSPTTKQQISPRSLRLRRSRSPEKISRCYSSLSRSPPHSICSSHRSVDSFKRSPTHQWSNNPSNFVDSNDDDPSSYNNNPKNFRRSSIKIHANSDQFQIEKSLTPEKSSPYIVKEKSEVPVIDLIDLDDDDENDGTIKNQNHKQGDNNLLSLIIEVSDDEGETLQAPPPPIISVQAHSKEDNTKTIEKGVETIKCETNADDSPLIILIDDEAEPKKSDAKSSAKQSEPVKIENDPVGDKDTSVSKPSKANSADPSASEQPAEASTETWATKNANELHGSRVQLHQKMGLSQNLLKQPIPNEGSKPTVDCAAEISVDSTDKSSEFPDQPMVMIPQIDPVPQHLQELPGLANISPNEPRLNRFMPKAIHASPLIRDTAPPPPPSLPRLTPVVPLPTSSNTSANISIQLSKAKVDSDLTGSEAGDSNDSHARKAIREKKEKLFTVKNMLPLKEKSDNTKERATAEKNSQDKPKDKENVSKPINVKKIASSAKNTVADLKRCSRYAASPLEKQAKPKVRRARVNRIISSDSEIDDPMDKPFEPKKGSLRKRMTSQVNEFHELGGKSKKPKSKKAKQAAPAPVEQPTDVPEVNLLTPLKEIPYAEKRKRKPEAGTSKRRRHHQIPKNIDITKHWNYPGKENCLVCKEKHDDVVYHYVNEHRENEVLCARLQQEQLEALKAKPNMLCPIKKANIEKYCGKCVFCSEEINYSIGRYLEHIARHTGEFAYECNICGWRWAAKKDIFDHFKNECKKGAKLIYVYRYNLSDKMIEAYYCTICNYTQLNNANVVKHIRTEHDKQLVTSADYASLTIFKVGESREIDDIIMSNETSAEANERDEYMEEIPVNPSDDRVVECSPDSMDYVKGEMFDDLNELQKDVEDQLKELMESPEAADSVEIEIKPCSPLKLMETKSPSMVDMPSEQNPLVSQADAISNVFTEIPPENLPKIDENTRQITPRRRMSPTISYPTEVAAKTRRIIDMPPEPEYIVKEVQIADLEEPVTPPPPSKSEKPSPKVLALSNTNIKRVKHVGFEKISANVLKFYCLIETCEFLSADTVEDLREHMKKHTRKWNLACNICKNPNTGKNISANIDKEITHLISEHLPPYATSLLGPPLKESKSLKSKESCIVLSQNFQLENLFKCMGSYCVYTTRSSREMQFHVTSTHGNDLRALTCRYCRERFIHSNGLVDHISKAHGSSIYQCAHCFYRSCAAYSVQLHQRNSHKNQKNPKILVCSGTSYTFRTEVLEILDNRKMNIKPSKCPFCPKSVYVKHLLMDHIRKEHPHKEPVEVHISLYNCLYCSYGSQELQPIRIHMANEHPNRLLYVCGLVFIKSLHPATSVQGGSIDITSIKSTSLVHIGDSVNQNKFIITDGVTLNFDENSIEAVNSGQGADNLNARIRQMFGESALNFSDVETYMRKIAEGMQPDAIKSEETSELDQLVIAAVKDTGLTGKDLYRCGFPKCNQNFDSFTQFHRHIETHRGNEKDPIYRCPHCTSIIPLNKIRLHTIKHRRHRFICYFCAETCASQDLSIEHLKMEHQSQSNDFFYLTTDKDWTGQLSEEESRIFVAKPRHSTGDVTDTIWNLLRKRYDGESSDLPKTAEQKRPQSPVERKEEIIIPVFVSKDNRFICNLDKCTFAAKAAEELQLHLQERHPIMNGGQYSCAYCSYTMSSAQVKISRIGNHLCFHGPTIAVCNICNYYHYDRENILGHIRACHPFNFVTMTLHNRSTAAIKTKIEILYNQHIRSAEDSYKCTLCDDQILTECEDFFIHMREMHLLNVRFKCDLCAFLENSHEQVEFHSKKCHPDSPPRIRSIFLPASGKWVQNISQFELLIDYSERNEPEDVKEVSIASGNIKGDDANRLPNSTQKSKTSSTSKETANKDDKSNRKRQHNEQGKGASKYEPKKGKPTNDKHPANNDDKKGCQQIKGSSKRQSTDSTFKPTTSPKDQSSCQDQQSNYKDPATSSVPNSKEVNRTADSTLKALLLQSNPPEMKEEKKFLSLVPIDELMAKPASSSSETPVIPKISLATPAALTTCPSSIFTTTQQPKQQQYVASSCRSLVHQLQQASIPPPLPTTLSIGQQPSNPLINRFPTSSTEVHSNPLNQPITTMEHLREATMPSFQQRPATSIPPIEHVPITTMEQSRFPTSSTQVHSNPLNQPITKPAMEQQRGAVASYQQRPTVPIQQSPMTTMENLREATMPSFQQRPATSIPPIQHVPITTMEQSRFPTSSTQVHSNPLNQPITKPAMEQQRGAVASYQQRPTVPIQQSPMTTMEHLREATMPSFQQRPATSIPPIQHVPITTIEQSRGIMPFSHQQPATFSVPPITQNSVAPIQQLERFVTPPTQEVPRFEAASFQKSFQQADRMQMTSMQPIEQPQRMTLAAPVTVQSPTGTSIATIDHSRFSPPRPSPINVTDRAIDNVYLSCFNCNVRQNNSTELRVHFHSKHNGEGICFRIMKKLVCAYCPHYASFADLKIHHLNFHPNYTFISCVAQNHTQCSEYPIQFKELEQLKDHTVHRHNDLPTAMYSSFSFLNQRYLEELLQLGGSSMLFKCPDCEHFYIDSKSFQDHMISFHKLTPVLENYQQVMNSVIYGCNSCQVFFEAELVAVHHIQRHCALYGCNHCEMNFISHNLLRNHYSHFHKITEESYQRRNFQESINRLMEMLLRFKNGLILSKREAEFTVYGRHIEFIEMIDRMQKAELHNTIENQKRIKQMESVAQMKRENEANLFQHWSRSNSLPSY